MTRRTPALRSTGDRAVVWIGLNDGDLQSYRSAAPFGTFGHVFRAPGGEESGGTTNDGGLVMDVDVTDFEYLDRLLVPGSSTPPVVFERRRDGDRRCGQERRKRNERPVTLDQGDRAASARGAVTGLEYATPWQLPPPEAGG
jgi:hypothetical protein